MIFFEGFSFSENNANMSVTFEMFCNKFTNRFFKNAAIKFYELKTNLYIK